MKNIVLLHGALGSEDELSQLKTKLINDGHQVWSFDFSGHGSTPFESEFGINQFTLELEAFINNNRIYHPVLFGYSMGAYVAINYAIRKSASIDKIISLGTKFYWTEAFVKKETSLLNLDALSQYAAPYLQKLKHQHGDKLELLLTKTIQMMYDLKITHLSFLEQLSTLKVPLLIIRSENDRMVEASESLSVSKLLSRSSLSTLSNSKHALNTVNIDELFQMIKKFSE